jgi:hypothetical protein
MPEFKFSCPQCGQRILCDSAYAGAQINCPGCQQSIIVPPSPAAAAPPPILPPSAPVGRGPSAPAAAPRAPIPPPKKSHTLRNVLVITACVIVLAGLAALGWFGYSKFKAQQAAKKGNPAAMVAAPTGIQQTEALDILSKMQNAYTNLNSLELSGTSVMDLDMSKLTAADLDPKATKTKKSHRPNGMPKSIATTMDVSIKLERPNLYWVKEDSRMSFGLMTVSNILVTWSPGETNYSLFLMNGGAFKRYTTVKDRGTALMAGGQPSLLALAAMQLFFNDAGNTSKLIRDLGQTADDQVNGQDCYTLTAKIFGQKLKMWVSKSTYMIMQSQVTFGAPISDDDIDTAFDSFNTKTNMTAAQIAQQKAQVKQQAAMMTKIRGTMTDICADVQSNPSFTPGDFSYRVPHGTKLIPSPF